MDGGEFLSVDLVYLFIQLPHTTARRVCRDVLTIRDASLERPRARGVVKREKSVDPIDTSTTFPGKDIGTGGVARSPCAKGILNYSSRAAFLAAAPVGKRVLAPGIPNNAAPRARSLARS